MSTRRKLLSLVESGDSHILQIHMGRLTSLCREMGLSGAQIVAIIGQARQGKSLLMNALYGSDVFEVSPQTEPCTKGVDASSAFPLADLGVTDCPHDSKVVVFDTEGQGDHGAAYDTTMALPILLLSRVIIFNWFGRPARNTILQNLSFLAEAAQRLRDGNSPGAGLAKLGYLHIVLRDCHDTTGATELLFHDEPETARSPSELLERNRMRRILRESFISLSVWALPHPINDGINLATTALKVSDCSPGFMAQVARLKASIGTQLATSIKQAIDGPTLEATLPLLVEAVNEQRSVLCPASLFEQGQHRLVDQLVKDFDAHYNKKLDGLLSTEGPLAPHVVNNRIHAVTQGLKKDFNDSMQRFLPNVARLGRAKVKGVMTTRDEAFTTKNMAALEKRRADEEERLRRQEAEAAKKREAELEKKRKEEAARAKAAIKEKQEAEKKAQEAERKSQEQRELLAKQQAEQEAMWRQLRQQQEDAAEERRERARTLAFELACRREEQREERQALSRILEHSRRQTAHFAEFNRILRDNGY